MRCGGAERRLPGLPPVNCLRNSANAPRSALEFPRADGGPRPRAPMRLRPPPAGADGLGLAISCTAASPPSRYVAVSLLPAHAAAGDQGGTSRPGARARHRPRRRRRNSAGARSAGEARPQSARRAAAGLPIRRLFGRRQRMAQADQVLVLWPRAHFAGRAWTPGGETIRRSTASLHLGLGQAHHGLTRGELVAAGGDGVDRQRIGVGVMKDFDQHAEHADLGWSRSKPGPGRGVVPAWSLCGVGPG